MDVIRLLVSAKANIQARNNGTGCVPLHDAARQGHLASVKVLLQLGAPYLPRSAYGELPVDFANDGGHKDVVKYLGELFLELIENYNFLNYFILFDF